MTNNFDDELRKTISNHFKTNNKIIIKLLITAIKSYSVEDAANCNVFEMCRIHSFQFYCDAKLISRAPKVHENLRLKFV